MPGAYQVKNVRAHVEINPQTRTPVKGYMLDVYLDDYQETHEVFVTSRSEEEAKARIAELLAWRAGLAKLG